MISITEKKKEIMMFFKNFRKNYLIIKHKNTIDKAYAEFIEGNKENYFKLIEKAEKIADKLYDLH